MKVVRQDTRFDLTLDAWVTAALSRGVRSFAELVRALPGVYPADVSRAVGRLRGRLPRGWRAGVTAPARPAPPPDGWPVEHPLDFDWRFTPDGVRILLDRCDSAETVALLGTPSLTREAVGRGRHSGVTLFDRNPAVVAAVREAFPGFAAVRTDLVWGEPVAADDAHVTVADPPWYPEHTAAFLWAASRLTRVGGRVLLSLPPVGTRPGIRAERRTVLARAASFGLREESIEPGVLSYRTPPFEQNALTAAGLPPLADWRRGDLAVFVVTERSCVMRPDPATPPEVWEEETVGAVRIKCRASPGDGFRDPTLSPAVPGGMLASVSRRHPVRPAVGVWTSGNRVFRCAGSDLFRVILSALRRGAEPVGAVAAALGTDLSAGAATLVRRASTQAADLVRWEERELSEYGHRRHERDLVRAV
jgi:hypothetical protein